MSFLTRMRIISYQPPSVAFICILCHSECQHAFDIRLHFAVCIQYAFHLNTIRVAFGRLSSFPHSIYIHTPAHRGYSWQLACAAFGRHSPGGLHSKRFAFKVQSIRYHSTRIHKRTVHTVPFTTPCIQRNTHSSAFLEHIVTPRIPTPASCKNMHECM